jgi:hypothetical protein
VQRPRSNLHLVLANVRVLLFLVMTQLRYAGDGTAESMLIIAHLGATADRQGVVVDRPSAASDRQSAIV